MDNNNLFFVHTLLMFIFRTKKCVLPIAHRSLFIAHCSSLIVHCSSLIAHCSLLIVNCQNFNQMNRPFWVTITVLLAGMGWNVLPAQTTTWSNWRTKSLERTYPREQIDTLTIIPNAFHIIDELTRIKIDTSFYQLDNTDLVWLVDESLLPQAMQATYRVFPFDIAKPLARFDSVDTQKAIDESVIGFDYNPYADQQPLIDFKGLNYNGSFARGISFGNNQDLVLNSSFNLQLAGTLGDDVEVLAAITDENIPLQPEGNTQQLREFDRIFIQLKKEDSQLIAGDYELRRPKSYFINYFKKLQGATFSNKLEVGEGGTLSTDASIAISRGKFARNNILQQEGNQGPYRLQGNAGERFIIVLAGTEKVFLDGKLMKRGIEEDYIIDYNRGEVTFTNKRLITKDSRIIVEFEYSDQNFNRTLYAVNTEYAVGGLKLHFNLFNEQDGKNTTGGNQTLTDSQKQLLSQAGDGFQNTLVNSLQPINEEVDELRVTYELRDTLTNCGTMDSVLVFSADPEVQRYTARFTFVGQGNGNYVIDNAQRTNERVYKWVAPDTMNCTLRGAYEPVIQLIAPKKLQLMAFGASYAFNEDRSEITTEIALSQNDQNRFSGLDGEDDQGWAAYATFKNELPLSKEDEDWIFNSILQYEFKHKNYQQLNPYRAPEFQRDWNLTNVQGLGEVERATENLAQASLSLVKKNLGVLTYEFSSFFRDSLYTGIRHLGQFNLDRKGWEIDLTNDLLTSREINQKNRFHRPRFNVTKRFDKLGGWSIGTNGEREKSTKADNRTDTLFLSSFFFDRYQFTLDSPQDKKYRIGMSYNRRIDYQPEGKTFAKNADARELNLNGQWQPGRALRLKGNITYRDLTVSEKANISAETGETILGRMDMNTTLAKGAIRSVSTYEVGSGQEPRVEFTFVQVAQGQGTHIWLDSLFNNDGIIQPNEMEIAPFPDIADFIRINTFTNDFIRTNNVLFNQSLQLNPKAVWFSKEGVRKFLSRFSTQSTAKIIRKTIASEGVAAWNPFQLAIADTALVSVTASIRNILFFNRGNPTFDIQIGQNDNRNKIVQTAGFESRQLSERFIKSRLNFSRTISGELEMAFGNRISDSEFFDSRDYDIQFFRLSPELTYLPLKNLRFAFRYKFQNDENILPAAGEKANQHDLNLEISYNQSAKTTVRGRFSWVQIDFAGKANSPVGFAILNGLQDGRNLLWNLSLDRQIAKNIRLNLSYDGRKTGENRMVHVGRAQVAAVF